jgi:hypothetical protein
MKIEYIVVLLIFYIIFQEILHHVERKNICNAIFDIPTKHKRSKVSKIPNAFKRNMDKNPE